LAAEFAIWRYTFKMAPVTSLQVAA